MTSSADTRRQAGATAPAPSRGRRRVAGSRRRVTGETPGTENTATTGATDATETDVVPGAPRLVAEPPVVDDAVVGEDETPTTDLEDDLGATPVNRRPWLAVGALVASLALLASVLVWSLRPALGDAQRGAAVSSARTSLETLLSYSGATFDAHVAEVTPRLAPPFKDQFTKVATTDIKPLAVKNGATVQAKVYEAGVMDTTGDGGEGSVVRVLAFVNQATTTTAEKTPAIDQNRVIATMTLVGDRWLISDLAAF